MPALILIGIIAGLMANAIAGSPIPVPYPSATHPIVHTAALKVITPTKPRTYVGNWSNAGKVN